ncbi:SDR family NAD(P)-dependent oxidoreductase [Sphingomonas cavernae]|uniref:SDR family NAD(P)-dependent oxidoreductase n=1 Tax=Sphingomonas cavernae TaxID=2320861 RepID=A0A418WKS3_9SPHN|nr:SDR family NAD(P)-dependent oxidoreductase [Sphingomonas cavernae]RJF90644.1 SDR family NAD(P)-dependent oxidoreductase [Sphingomonas cavernae]
MTFTQRFGPWALVTGASSGIGEAFASLLAERGLNLVLVARRKDRLESLATSLRAQHGIEIEAVELDLAAPEFTESLLHATKSKDVGLVISNAGFGFKGLHHLQDRQQLSALIDVNVRAPTLIANAFASRLIERGRGGIVLTGSVEGFISSPWSGAYAATKAYVHSLGEAIWDELKPHGVNVLVLAPGATDTENLRRQGFDAQQMSNVMTPRAVAEQALANIDKGPVYVPGRTNRAMIRFLGVIPKRKRIGLVGKGTKMAIDKAKAG